MAYWQNGKVYVHTGTQSTVQTVPAVARWLNIDPEKVVLISEYTGGGFGSKITGAISLIIPALLSKKCNAPVMMRITPRGGALHRPRAPQPDGPDEGRLLQGRPASRRSICSSSATTVRTIRWAMALVRPHRFAARISREAMRFGAVSR